MLRAWAACLLSILCCCPARLARADPAFLVATEKSGQIRELQLAKVMARDASLWLSVDASGPGRLAIVTTDRDVEGGPAADAWLRALDFATRTRVAPPLGPLADCNASRHWPLVDSGLPERPRLSPSHVEDAGSELEVRVRLADAGLSIDTEAPARFAHRVAGPYRIAIYDVPEGGGKTSALRVIESDDASEALLLDAPAAPPVPLSLIALASRAVLPSPAESADTSEFPIIYGSASSASDYVQARTAFLRDNPGRWLVEAEATRALFAWTVFAGYGVLAPAVTRYLRDVSGAQASTCGDRVLSAWARHSHDSADFICAGARDLALSLEQSNFADLRLTRLYGELGTDGLRVAVVAGEVREPLSFATDMDIVESACPLPNAGDPPGTPPRGPERDLPPADASGSTGDADFESGATTASDSRCDVTFVGSSGNESCHSEPTPSESGETDSCTADSSSSGSNSDSCTHGSDADSSSNDSCAGDSSSDDEASGCSKSEYDGDTCAGDSQASSEATRAALRTAKPHPKKRTLRLSLLSLLLAAVSLPLRRLCSSR